MNRAIMVLVAIVLAGQAASCVAVAAAGLAGAGVTQYNRNDVEQDFREDLERTWHTTLEALQPHCVGSPTTSLTSTEGTISFEDAVARVERHPEGFTRVVIRVGTFHTAEHEERAQYLMQRVAEAMRQQDDFWQWTERVRQLE